MLIGLGDVGKTLSWDSVSESSLLRTHAGNGSSVSSNIESRLGSEERTCAEFDEIDDVEVICLLGSCF